MASERLLVKVSEAAERLSISRSRAYQMAQEGSMPGVVRFGKSIRVNVRRLEEWAEANASQSEASRAA